jgi:hypothetical protein
LPHRFSIDLFLIRRIQVSRSTSQKTRWFGNYLAVTPREYSLMSFAESPSATSEREERVFAAAFGIMDSSQDGEAIAAFMRVRSILHRQGGGFRRLLERSYNAERLNEELGQQNTQLLRENAALHARDSRPVTAAKTAARGMFSTCTIPELSCWDTGLVIIVAAWAELGLISTATALTLCAAVLIAAALAKWFCPLRFFVGVLIALSAYGMVAPTPVTVAATSAPAYPLAEPTTVSEIVRTAPSPVVITPVHAGAMPTTLPAASIPSRQSDISSPWPASADPSRRTRTARVDCGTYQLQPGFACARRPQW